MDVELHRRGLRPEQLYGPKCFRADSRILPRERKHSSHRARRRQPVTDHSDSGSERRFHGSPYAPSYRDLAAVRRPKPNSASDSAAEDVDRCEALAGLEVTGVAAAAGPCNGE